MEINAKRLKYGGMNVGDGYSVVVLQPGTLMGDGPSTCFAATRCFQLDLAPWLETIVIVYVLIGYFTQYVSWYRDLNLCEQQLFLLLIPFLGL